MGRPIDRRSFLACGISTAAAVLAAATGADLIAGDGLAGAVQTNGRGRNGVSLARPKRGGTLTFGTDAEEQGFLPTTARFDQAGVMYARTVFDPLTIITESGGVAPYLAQAVTPNSGYTSWTVTLRPDLRFHDGTPCDGAALLANFEAHKNSLLTGSIIDPILAGFAQTGPLTVVANFNAPWVPFPYYLAGGIGGQIGYPVALSMLNNPNGTTHPVGTGPFVFESWMPNDHFTAKRNPNYWRKGLPYLDAITYRPIPDADTRSQALQSGSVNIILNATPSVTRQYRGNKAWSYIDDSGPVVGEPDMICLLVNTVAAPFNNPDVRLAVAKSIDTNAYSKIIDLGVNAPSNGLFVRGTPYYSDPGYPKYDPRGAAALISKVRHQTGKPVSFTLDGVPTPSVERSGQYLQQALQAAGMKVSLATTQQDELINNALVGKFQLSQWRQFGAVQPDLNYIFWSSTTDGPIGGLAVNMARNKDPRVDAALTAGRQASNTTTRYKAYQTVNERFAVDLPYIWLDRAVWAVIAKPTVQNFANPTTPTGQKAYGMTTGSIWPTQIWMS